MTTTSRSTASGVPTSDILAFEREFPGARLVTLEANYRSSANVIAVANAVIERAQKHYPKRLVAAGTHESLPVEIYGVESERRKRSSSQRTSGSLLSDARCR